MPDGKDLISLDKLSQAFKKQQENTGVPFQNPVPTYQDPPKEEPKNTLFNTRKLSARIQALTDQAVKKATQGRNLDEETIKKVYESAHKQITDQVLSAREQKINEWVKTEPNDFFKSNTGLTEFGDTKALLKSAESEDYEDAVKAHITKGLPFGMGSTIKGNELILRKDYLQKQGLSEDQVKKELKNYVFQSTEGDERRKPLDLSKYFVDGEPTEKFKRDVFEIAQGDPRKFKKAAQDLINYETGNWRASQSPGEKASQEFEDWLADQAGGVPYALYRFGQGHVKAASTIAETIGGVKSLAEGESYAEGQDRSRENIDFVSNANRMADPEKIGTVNEVMGQVGNAVGEIIGSAVLFGGSSSLFSGALRTGRTATKTGTVATAMNQAVNPSLANSAANKSLLAVNKFLNKSSAEKAAKYLDDLVGAAKVMGLSTYNSYLQEALDKGYSPEEAEQVAAKRTAVNLPIEAFFNPLAKGVKSVFFKSKPIKRILNPLKESTRTALVEIGKTGLGEAGEEVAQGIADKIFDFQEAKQRGDLPEDAPFDIGKVVEESIQDGATGFLAGVAMTAIGGHGNLPSRTQSRLLSDAIDNPVLFQSRVADDLKKGRITEDQAEYLLRFVKKVTPEFVQASKKLEPEVAAQFAIEKARLDEVNKKLETEVNQNKIKDLQEKQKESQKTLTQLESGTYLRGRTITGEEMREISRSHTPNGVEGKQELSIVQNGPYKTEVIDITPFKEEVAQEIAILNNPELASEYKSQLDPLLEEKEAIEAKYRPKVDKETGITLVPKREKTEEDQEDLKNLNQQISEVKAQFEGISGKEEVIGFTPQNEVPPVVGETIIDGKKRIAHALANGETEMEVARPITNEEADGIIREETDQIVGADEPNFEGLKDDDVSLLESVVTVFNDHEDPAQGYAAAAKELVDKGVTKKKAIEILGRVQNNNQPKTILTQYYNSVKNGKRKVKEMVTPIDVVTVEEQQPEAIEQPSAQVEHPKVITEEDKLRIKDARRWSYREFKFRRKEELTPEEYQDLRVGEMSKTERAYEDIAGLVPNQQTGRIPVSPIVGQKPKKLSEIIFDISKGIKQRLFFLKPGRRKSLGTYSAGNSAVKIKFNGDLDTTAHEIGHSIDDHFGLLKSLETSGNFALEQELMQLAPFGSTPPKGHPNARMYKLGEGFAEWLRAYIANPEEAKKFTNIFNLYESTVSQSYKAALDQFSVDFRTFAGASGRDMILANVETEPKRKNLLQEIFDTSDKNNAFTFGFWDKLAANFINPLRAMNLANDYLKGIKGIDEQLPEDNPTLLARTLLGVDGKVSELLTSGMIDENLNVLTDENGNPKNLKWLLEPLDNTDESTIKRDKDDVVAYMIAERTIELSEKFGREDILTGIGGGIFKDTDAAKKALDEFNEDPRLERIKLAASRYREMADDVLKYMVGKGRMSQEQYEQIKENNIQYVALQRVMDIEPDREVEVFAKGGNKLASKVEVVRNIKGSSKEIKDPYYSLLTTIYKGVKEADRNEVLLTLRDLLVPERNMYEGEQVRLSDIGVQAKQGDKETVTIFVDGKPEYWKFQADIYKSLKGLDNEAYRLPGIVTALPKLLRWTVTHAPVFALRNITRDTQDRLIKSNVNNINNAFGLTDLVGDKKHWEEVARAGGLNAGYYMRDQDHYYGLMNEAIKEVSKKGIVLDAGTLKSTWRGYENILSKSETLNRVAEYRAALRQAKEKGLDDYNAKLYAAYRSRDLIDFGLMGHYMKYINQIVPFSNAAVQGIRSAAVSAKENPTGFAFRILLFSVIPEIAIWLLAHSDEEEAKQYEEMPDYQRDLFYNFKIGPDKWASIPKPYELSLAGAVTSRALSLAYGNDKAMDGLGETVWESFVPFDKGNVAGPMQTIVEGISNYEFFRDKYIIPPYEQPLTLALRDRDRASRFGKALESVSGIDARKVDHFTKGSMSYFGDYILKLSNIGRADGDKFGLSDIGFVKKTPAYNSKTVQEFMEKSAEYGLNSNLVVKRFKVLTKSYFNAKSDEERDRISKQMIEYAEKELPTVEQLGQRKIKNQ